jgi:hypothetical protein
MVDMRTALKRAKIINEMRDPSPERSHIGRTISLRDVVKDRERGLSAADRTWLHLQTQGVVDGDTSVIGPMDGVEGVWKDQPAFLVGGSRALKNAMDAGFKLSMLDGFHSIGVNHVVSDYHDFEWLFFMDKSFLSVSAYDVLKEYKGRVFAHLKTHLEPSQRVTLFYTQHEEPKLHLIDGLYSFIVSGVTAVNLALITGANPIYLMGLDNGGCKDNKTSTHYKDTYPGERVGYGNWSKFTRRVPEVMLRYSPWADRFVNVDPLGDITAFKKMDVREIPELKEKFA